MGPGVIPDGLIVCALKANEPHVSGSRIQGNQVFDNSVREILIEE